MNRGLSRMNLNDYSGAINDFESVLNVNKFNENAYLNLGVAKLKLERYNEAISDLKQFGVNEDELNLNYREDLFE